MEQFGLYFPNVPLNFLWKLDLFWANPMTPSEKIPQFLCARLLVHFAIESRQI